MCERKTDQCCSDKAEYREEKESKKEKETKKRVKDTLMERKNKNRLRSEFL